MERGASAVRGIRRAVPRRTVVADMAEVLAENPFEEREVERREFRIIFKLGMARTSMISVSLWELLHLELLEPI